MATIVRRKCASIRSLVYASTAVASFMAGRAESLAMEMTYYADRECAEPLMVFLYFGELSWNGTTAMILEDFNDCAEVVEGTFAVTVCDGSTGDYGIRHYSDSACTQLVGEGIMPSTCPGQGTATTSSGLGSTETTSTGILVTWECSDEEPLTLSSSPVNFVSQQYSDEDCADPIDNTEIVYSGLDGSCSSNITNGYAPFLFGCREDGAFISQQFASDDDTCTGDVWAQLAYHYENFDCVLNEIGGSYYRPLSCTTESATIVGSATPFTPAPIAAQFATPPSPEVDGDSMPIAIYLSPAPTAAQAMTPEVGGDAMPIATTYSPTPTAAEVTTPPTLEVNDGSMTIATTYFPASTSVDYTTPRNTDVDDDSMPVTTPDSPAPAATEVIVPLSTEAPTTTDAVKATSGAAPKSFYATAVGVVAATYGLGLVAEITWSS